MAIPCINSNYDNMQSIFLFAYGAATDQHTAASAGGLQVTRLRGQNMDTLSAGEQRCARMTDVTPVATCRYKLDTARMQ